MNGGTITGNTCSEWGGGIYLAKDSILNLNGGTITNNRCGSDNNGGGIHVSAGAYLYISGNPVVSGNKRGDALVNNVNLANDALISVNDELADTASIGISVSTAPAAGSPRVLTRGLSGKGTAGNFVSDAAAYGVGLNADGEAMLAAFCSVTIDTDIQHGSVIVEPAEYIQGSTVTLTVQADVDYVLSELTVKYGDTDVPCTKTVSFNSTGGSAVEAQTVLRGGKAAKPADPHKVGCIFRGWKLDGDDYDFEASVTRILTLTAMWGNPAELVLPLSLVTIQEQAFSGLSVHSVYLGDSVEEILSEAFADCASLEWIRIPPSVTIIAADAFKNCSADLTIYGEGNCEAQRFADQMGFCYIG